MGELLSRALVVWMGFVIWIMNAYRCAVQEPLANPAKLGNNVTAHVNRSSFCSTP